jgi:hypothetical protein
MRLLSVDAGGSGQLLSSPSLIVGLATYEIGVFLHAYLLSDDQRSDDAVEAVPVNLVQPAFQFDAQRSFMLQLPQPVF